MEGLTRVARMDGFTEDKVSGKKEGDGGQNPEQAL